MEEKDGQGTQGPTTAESQKQELKCSSLHRLVPRRQDKNEPMQSPEKQESSQCRRYGLGLLLHFTASVGILVGLGSLTPCLETDSAWHRQIWFTGRIGVGDLLAWLSVLATGFAFVAKIRSRRPKWYMDRNKRTNRNIIKLLVAGLVTWPIGPRFFLSSCTDYSESLEPQLQRTFVWNVLYFGLPYSIGLCFSLLDDVSRTTWYAESFPWRITVGGLLQIPMASKLVIDPAKMKDFPLAVILLAIGGFSLISGALGFQMYLHYLENRLKIYLPVLLASFSALITVSYFLRATHRLHVHHYALFGSLMLLFTSRHPFSATVFGLFAGISVEVRQKCKLLFAETFHYFGFFLFSWNQGSARWGINKILRPLTYQEKTNKKKTSNKG